jgi:hypothetical protein
MVEKRKEDIGKDALVLYKFAPNPYCLETGKYISDLLYHYDCVIISGLGGFVAEYHPAVTDPANHRIAPPSKTFFFDEDRKIDGNILVSYIASMELKPEEEVRQAIEGMAQDTRNRLLKNEKVSLGDLGYFYRSASGKTCFEFTGVKNFYAESLGLLEVELPVHAETAKIVHPVAHIPSVAKPAMKGTAPMVPDSRKHHPRALLVSGIVLLLLAGGAGLVYYTVGFSEAWNSIRHFTTRGKVTVKHSDTVASIDTGMGKTLNEQTRIKNALQVAREDSIAKLRVADLKHYYLIAASFRDYEKALQMQKELVDKGFPSEIVNTDLRWYRVTLGSFTDRSQALLELEKVRAATRNDAIWLLPI